MRSTLWFEDLLNLYDIPHEWRLLSGYHAEEYWKDNLEQYLRWYTQRWRVECYNRLNPLIACTRRSIRLH